MPEVITDNLDLWTSALLTKSTAGRGSNGKLEAYGIKKLRELILELAVRGELLPQDPNDEPASVLLKRIKAEKVKLIAEGIIKKDKPLPPISEEEKPFALPLCWEWIRLPEVYFSISPSGRKLLSSEIKDAGSFPVVDQGQRYIAGYTDVAGLLINLPGPVIVFGDHTTERKYIDFNFVAGADGVKILRPILQDEHFFFRQLQGYRLEERGYARHFKVLNDNLYALPPIEEQHRIVAKVDELMALCDQLEQQQTHSIAAHQALVETLLGTLTRVTSQQEFSEAWARIASHFDTLFTTEASIDRLKQTILQLAVMGKLVPQDPDDEPASGLLERIAEEKGRLVKEGLLKKQQPLTEVTDVEMPFEIPDNWEWSRLGSLGIGNTGKTPSTGNPEYYGGVIPFIGPGQITPAGEILDSDKNLAESGCEYSTVAEPGDVLMVCIGGSIGKSAITVSRVAFNQQINCIRPIFVSSVLLNYAMNTPHFQSAILEKATGSATPIINRSKWEELLVPIPPEAEQYRIVAKVDELMALCDALKASLADAKAIQLHLADAIVEQAIC